MMNPIRQVRRRGRGLARAAQKQKSGTQVSGVMDRSF